MARVIPGACRQWQTTGERLAPRPPIRRDGRRPSPVLRWLRSRLRGQHHEHYVPSRRRRLHAGRHARHRSDHRSRALGARHVSAYGPALLRGLARARDPASDCGRRGALDGCRARALRGRLLLTNRDHAPRQLRGHPVPGSADRRLPARGKRERCARPEAGRARGEVHGR